MNATTAIILAAGKSTRMKSDLPKVLHELCGRPMLAYVLDACRQAGIERLVVVVGYGKQLVIDAFQDDGDITWVEQTEQKGTGHAVLCTEPVLGSITGAVVVIAGDMPLVQSDTISKLLETHSTEGSALTLATTVLENPTGYGRIVRDGQGDLLGIVEHNDCSPEQLLIEEVNPSYYCFDGGVMYEALHKVQPNNVKGEYYITDALTVLRDAGRKVFAVAAMPAEQATGINSRAEVADVNRMLQRRIQQEHMDVGVTIVSPASTWVDSGAVIGLETIIYPFSYICGRVRVGDRCRIGPYAYLADGTVLDENTTVSHNVEFPAAGVSQ